MPLLPVRRSYDNRHNNDVLHAHVPVNYQKMKFEIRTHTYCIMPGFCERSSRFENRAWLLFWVPVFRFLAKTGSGTRTWVRRGEGKSNTFQATNSVSAELKSHFPAGEPSANGRIISVGIHVLHPRLGALQISFRNPARTRYVREKSSTSKWRRLYIFSSERV